MGAEPSTGKRTAVNRTGPDSVFNTEDVHLCHWYVSATGADGTGGSRALIGVRSGVVGLAYPNA